MFVVLLAAVANFHIVIGIQFQIATINNPDATRITQACFNGT